MHYVIYVFMSLYPKKEKRKKKNNWRLRFKRSESDDLGFKCYYKVECDVGFYDQRLFMPEWNIPTMSFVSMYFSL